MILSMTSWGHFEDFFFLFCSLNFVNFYPICSLSLMLWPQFCLHHCHHELRVIDFSPFLSFSSLLLWHIFSPQSRFSSPFLFWRGVGALEHSLATVASKFFVQIIKLDNLRWLNMIQWNSHAVKWYFEVTFWSHNFQVFSQPGGARVRQCTGGLQQQVKFMRRISCTNFLSGA